MRHITIDHLQGFVAALLALLSGGDCHCLEINQNIALSQNSVVRKVSNHFLTAVHAA